LRSVAEEINKQNRTAESNQDTAPLILSAVAASAEVEVTIAVLGAVLLHLVALHRVLIHCDAAFGIFLWLEVLDFDRFSFFVLFVRHGLALFYWIVFCLGWVSDTEQQLMPARDVLFWNQVIQTNQFFPFALRPLIS
jgi:hypothetical protein